MKAFTTLTATAAPLFRPNINTDIITPMQYLIGTPRETMGSILFAPWRFNEDGTENSDFVLNNEPFRKARILIAGSNFACGSSRESAVWALQGYGFRAVIAPSFSEIFVNSCYQSGVLPVVLEEDIVATFARQAEAAPHTSLFTVDLENSAVIPPQGEPAAFDIGAFRRMALLEGLDDLGLARRRSGEILTFRKADRVSRPWVYV